MSEQNNQGLGWPFQAMTFKTGSRDLLETAVSDPAVAFEQKLDGTRCMILWDNGHYPVIVQRNGAPLKHSASLPTADKVLASLAALPTELPGWRFILDGELMWSEGYFVAFDVPSITCASNPLVAPVTPQTPFGMRRDRLEHLHDWVLGDSEVRLVAHARTEQDKRDLAGRIQHINGEGVLVKRLDAPYGIGTRVSHSLKVKFTKTCDVIVTSANLERNKAGNLSGSIAFGLLADTGEDGQRLAKDAGELAWTGSCSAIGRGDVQAGDVIEVEYLAYMAGGGIREPRMLRKRTDKMPWECTTAQFREHSRAVL